MRPSVVATLVLALAVCVPGSSRIAKAGSDNKVRIATLAPRDSDLVRGFLKAYARAVALPVEDVLARYTATRRVAWVTPLPMASPVRRSQSKRFGVAIAFVLLLILFTLALSIVLRPRGHDMPRELSQNETAAHPRA